MPSLLHDGLIKLFHNRPELAPELLRDALGVKLPAYGEARIGSIDLTEVEPTEYRADLVVLLVDGKPVFAIIVEVQLELKEHDRKFFTWPAYAASLRSNLECEVCVLVVTPNEAVAERARRPIVLGPNGSFTPLVLGPTAVPVIVEPERLRGDVELGVLSAMAHGRKDEVALKIASAVIQGCRNDALAPDRAVLYLDLVALSLNEASRLAFGKLIMTNYEFTSEFGKKYGPALFTALREAEEAKAEAKAQVEAAEAKAEARAKAAAAEAEARIKAAKDAAKDAAKQAAKQAAREALVGAKAQSVISVLEARGIAVPAKEAARILACSDCDVLDRWLVKSVTVTSSDELVGS